MEKRGLFAALSTILGATIGAGIFALPYVIAQSGFLLGFVHLVVVGFVMVIVALYLAEVVLRTKGKHQLTGLAERYLGTRGKWLMHLAMVTSIYGALIAYAFGAGEVLEALTGLPARLMMLVFFVILVIVIYFKLEVLEDFEEIFTPLKIIALVVLSGVALFFMHRENLVTMSWRDFFVPYGVVLFAYTSVSIIPEVTFEVKQKRVVKSAIILSVILAGVLYAAYTAAVLGVLGTNLTEVTTISLGQALGPTMSLLLNVFALLALATAFAALGFALKENFILDLKKRNMEAWLYTTLVPFLFLLAGWGGFVRLIELTAIVGIGLILVLIIFMHARARVLGDREPEFQAPAWKMVNVVMILLVLAGVVFELGRLLT